MVFLTMDFLPETFEEGVEKYWHDKYMFTCIDAEWKKLTEYYWKADRAPAYIAAIVLDPTKKWAFFRDWEPKWQTSAKQSLKSFWEHSYHSSTGLIHRADPANIATDNSNNAFSRWIARTQAQPVDNLDKLEQYVSEACLVDVESLISRWMSPVQRSRFPLLSSTVIDIFSIPAMFSEAERVFSGAKHRISDESLSHYILTQSKLLNAWNLGFGRKYLPKKISPKPCTNNVWRFEP